MSAKTETIREQPPLWVTRDQRGCTRLTPRAKQKMKTKQTSYTADAWIEQQELPVNPNIKVIKGLDQEEIEAYHDFIRWYLTQEHLTLLSIPNPETVYDLWPFELDEFANNISAFNTIDCQRLYPNKFNYQNVMTGFRGT